jgi:hypothetical protein
MMARIYLCLGIIMSGLALRHFGPGLGIPASIVKYGGSVLWGAMVFFIVAIIVPRFRRSSIAAVSAVIAVGVELFRLVHTSLLDAFRMTLAGALLLGRIFSLWDILAYVAGIWLALALDRVAGPIAAQETPAAQSPS